MFSMSQTTLRRVLWADALSGALIAVSHGFASDAVSAMAGLPPAALLAAALIVAAAAALAAWLATRERPPAAGVRMLALGNFAWVAASAWVAFASGWPLTSLGLAWVLLQAVAVLVLAELEWAGSRSGARLAAA